MDERSWNDPEPVALPPDYLADCPEILRLVLWRRGMREDRQARAFLDPLGFRLPEVAAYPQLVAAVDRALRAIQTGEPITVWGDHDADGQTATAVLVGTLGRLGARVSYHIPSRQAETRGLNTTDLPALAAAGCRLVVTCDCGTNDAEAVAYARGLGMDVIITDHHQQHGALPAAVAVCNSSHLPAADPLHGLPGVAMAYLLARALFIRLDRAVEANRELDLVALGIIADVAGHTPAIRALLVRGLPRLRNGARPGVRALLAAVGARLDGLSTEAISFRLAPALNAAGRLAEARLGVELLLAPNDAVAAQLAARLLQLNQERRRLTNELEAEIARLLEGVPRDAPALVVDGVGWHPGIIGLVANHLAGLHGKPAVVIAHDPGGGPARGSVRGGAPSGSRVDVLAALTSQSHLLLTSGGHPGAAGFSLPSARVAAFREGFVAAVAACGDQQGPIAVQPDAVVPWSALDQTDLGPNGLYGTLLRLAPFGPGNPAPLLASAGLRLVGKRTFGAGGRHAALLLADGQGCRREAVWWRHDPAWQPAGEIAVAYTLSGEEWHGQGSVRLTLQALRRTNNTETHR